MDGVFGIVQVIVGGAIGFGASMWTSRINMKRDRRGVRQQIKALCRAVIIELGPAASMPGALSEITDIPIIDQIYDRIFESDVAVSFNDKELDALFLLALALRKHLETVRMVHGSNPTAQTNSVLQGSVVASIGAALAVLDLTGSRSDALNLVKSITRQDPGFAKLLSDAFKPAESA